MTKEIIFMSNDESTPVSKEEMDAAMKVIADNYNEQCLSAYKLVMENIRFSCNLSKANTVAESCTPNFRILIKQLSDDQRIYEYHPRIYDTVKAIQDNNLALSKKKDCPYYFNPSHPNNFWYDRSSSVVFTDVDELMLHIVKNHLF